MCVACKRINSVMSLSPFTFEVYLLVNLFTKLYVTLFFSELLSYLVGIKKRTSRTRETTLIFFFMYLCPLKPKSLQGRP